jgi:hypothetical protein
LYDIKDAQSMAAAPLAPIFAVRQTNNDSWLLEAPNDDPMRREMDRVRVVADLPSHGDPALFFLKHVEPTRQ